MKQQDPKRHIVDTLGLAAESRFATLHPRTPLPHNKRQVEPLSDAFTRHLDKPQLRVVRPGDPPALLSFEEAWARLRAEDPPLAAAIDVTVIGRRSADDAAPLLGISPSTANRRKLAGLAQLTIWTGLDERGVTCKVHNLTA